MDESASSGGDGSKDEPFKDIEDAIEEAGKEGGSQEIYVEDGSYDGGFTIGKSIKLIGEGKDKVTIAGTVYMDDDSELKEVTVKGGRTAISIDKGADVKIEDCVIKNFEKIGIDIEPGSGKLVLTDSKIKDGKGKGIYVQRGNEIELLGNEVVDNDEEGFDLRSKIKGIIRGNYIYKNGESGIEVIVGETELEIVGNTIKDNGASAVAAQFYEDMSEKGDIEIKNNKLSGNDNYALNCKKTQGGSTSKTYWTDSIKMSGNSISGNKDGSIYKLCHFDKEEEKDDSKDDKTDENEKAKKEAEEKERQEQLAREEARIAEDREKRQGQANQLMDEYDENIEGVKLNLTKVKKEGKVKVFFFGVDRKAIETVNSELTSKKEELERINSLLGGDYVKMQDGTQLKEKADSELEIVNSQLQYLEKRLKTFSLWGWILGLF